MNLRLFYPFRAAAAASVLLLPVLCAVSCGKRPAQIVIGSQSVSGQIVAEIVAQHLDHRLGHKVERRFGIGSGQEAYQELLTGTVSLYPAAAGAIETEILKEQPSSDSGVVWERARLVMDRQSKLALFPPLGYDDSPVMVIRAADAKAGNISTLSQAAAASVKWKIGASYEFHRRLDFIPALTVYNLPLAQIVRGMEPSALFPALDNGDLNMIAADSSDGRLTSAGYQVLADDRHAFPPYQACLLVREDALAAEPRLRPALNELSGKFTTAMVRQMSAEVDLDHRPLTDVAADFLQQAGLK